jgi:hypothetical protein
MWWAYIRGGGLYSGGGPIVGGLRYTHLTYVLSCPGNI